MFGLILLYSTLCAADTTTKKRLATTNYVDCKLSDKVNTSSILHALRGDYDVNDLLSADVVVNMFENYYDKDYIDKQDFIEYITADDKKCFSKYSDDIWILDNPPDIDSYVVNVRIISTLDDVEINASIVVENGNTTSIRNIGHYGSSDIENLWAFYPSNFTLTFYTSNEFRPAMSISACITSMYSGKYYSVEYIDNAITSLEDKIRTAAAGNYLSMDSVISDKKDVYEDDDVLTYKVLKDTYASQQALTTLKDSIYSKVEVDDIKEELSTRIDNAMGGEYILQTNVKSAFQDAYEAYDVFSAQFANSTFATKDELSTTASKYYGKDEIDGMLVGDYTEYITKSDGVCFYASGNGKWELTEYPSALNYTLEITFTSSTRTMHDTIRVEDGRVISYGVTDSVPNKYRFSPQYFQLTIEAGSDFQQFSSAQPGTSACIDAMYDGNANTGYYTREDINNRVFGDYKEYVPSGGKTCFTERDANTWELRNFPIVPSYTLVVTYGNGQDMRYEDTITVENGVVTGQSLTNGLMPGGTYEFRARDFSIHISDDNFFANVRPGADGDPRACIASMHSGEHKGMLHDYYTKAEVDDIRDVLDKKITEAADGDYIPTGNIETTLPDESVADDAHVLSTKASMSAFASKSSLTELSSTVTTINNKLTTDGVDNYLKRAEVINITSAIDKKQLDTHIALSADSAALIALERAGESDQVVRRNDTCYSTLVNRSTVEDIVNSSELYYRKSNYTLIYEGSACTTDRHGAVYVPRIQESAYTVVVEDILRDNKGTVMRTFNVIDEEVCGISSGNSDIGYIVMNANYNTIIQFDYGLMADNVRDITQMCVRAIYTGYKSELSFMEERMLERNDLVRNNTLQYNQFDDDHILTAAATKTLTNTLANTLISDASVKTYAGDGVNIFPVDRIALNKGVYLAIEACNDDYIFEGLLPMDVISINDECKLNISINNDTLSFQVFNSDSENEEFNIRLVVY